MVVLTWFVLLSSEMKSKLLASIGPGQPTQTWAGKVHLTPLTPVQSDPPPSPVLTDGGGKLCWSPPGHSWCPEWSTLIGQDLSRYSALIGPDLSRYSALIG